MNAIAYNNHYHLLLRWEQMLIKHTCTLIRRVLLVLFYIDLERCIPLLCTQKDMQVKEIVIILALDQFKNFIYH